MTLWIAMPRIVLEGEIAPGMDKSSKRTKDNSWILDGVAIAVGLATFLNHFHSVHTLNFIERYTQLLKVQFNKYSETLPKIVDIGKKTKSPAFPREIQVMISFARELRKYMMLPNDAMDGCIPPLFVELQ
ncbi:MAG: hypothetical protein EZS28_023206 [Streblomastix strix]|uniref:Uncharacterized protein n=1 Tax=Streblomastix strix TaxID=222440 RepID=A0A5J4VF83_9EUKA|nr:MAG: hypothetical protein EZS28_023206 [Streblomastix strix]